jgi:hypothetical protein
LRRTGWRGRAGTNGRRMEVRRRGGGIRSFDHSLTIGRFVQSGCCSRGRGDALVDFSGPCSVIRLMIIPLLVPIPSLPVSVREGPVTPSFPSERDEDEEDRGHGEEDADYERRMKLC